MPTVAATLSVAAIQKRCRDAAKTPKKKRTFSLRPGLYLQCRDGHTSAIFRYSRFHGGRAKTCAFGLGTFDPFSPHAAGQLDRLRLRVMELQHQRHTGRDPIAERAARRAEKVQVKEAREQKAAASAATFGKVTDAWLATHEPRAAEVDPLTGKQVRAASGWSLSHYQQTRWQLERYVLPAIAAKPVGDVTQRDIRDILEPLWKSKHVTATRLRTAMEAIFDYAIADAECPFSGPNLAVYKGGLKPLLPMDDAPTPRHFVGVPLSDVPGVVAALLGVGGLREKALVLAILTACRSVNAREAQWKEFDFAAATWTISGTKMKNELGWRSPLPAAALDMLSGLRPDDARPDDYVFPSIRGGCIGPNSLRFAMRDIGRNTEHPHGFRSVFRTWAAESSFDHKAAEFQLSHVETSATVAAYMRSDLLELRRPMLNEWARVCLGESNIVAFAARA